MFKFKKRNLEQRFSDLQEKTWKLENRFDCVCSLLGIAFDVYEDAHHIDKSKDLTEKLK